MVRVVCQDEGREEGNKRRWVGRTCNVLIRILTLLSYNFPNRRTDQGFRGLAAHPG